MDLCVLCFEEMDILGFQDERDRTDSCYKLECGHAFHTKCIIECLRRTNYDCPACNHHKTPADQITQDGLVKRLVTEIKKNEEIKILNKEFKETKIELQESITQLKKDIKQYIETRSRELKINEKRNYLIKSLAQIRSKAVSIAKEKSPLYLGALIGGRSRYWNGTQFEVNFFGRENGRSLYRLKHPRYYTNLY